jgi:chromosome segregation ATPase
MANPLPPDFKVALEQWRAMDEWLSRFRRLGDVLRECAAAYDRVAEAEKRQVAIERHIEAEEQDWVRRREGLEKQLDSLRGQLDAARAGWQQEHAASIRQADAVRQDLEATTAELMARRGELERLGREVQLASQALEDLRRQIRGLVDGALQQQA